MSDGFRVPYGETLTQKRLVRPDDADPQQLYRCPECAELLTLKIGTVKSRHFSHRSKSLCSGVGESGEHKLAKRLLAQWVNERKLPPVVYKCATSGCANFVDYNGIFHADAAVIESTALGPKIRPDVLVYFDGVPVLALEVFVSHAVTDEKANLFQIPFWELSASAILAEKPMLRIIRADTPLPECSRCRRLESERQAALEASRKVAEKHRLAAEQFLKENVWEMPGETEEPSQLSLSVRDDALRVYHSQAHAERVAVLCLQHRDDFGTFDGCPHKCFWCKPISRDWSKQWAE